MRRATAVAVLAQLVLAAAQACFAAERGLPSAIADLGLEESARRVDERPGWRRPEHVLVWGGDAPSREWLQEAAPGVRLTVVATQAEALAQARDADAVIGGCSVNVLAAGPRIRWMQAMHAGVERCVADGALRERDVLLTNMQRASSPVIAEHTIAFMFALARGLDTALAQQSRREWSAAYARGERIRVLHGKTLLVAGLGGIGTEVARRAHALGMRVIGTRARDRSRPDFVSYVGLADELPRLLPQADVVVNALPLTAETRGLFDARAFGAMKRSALFVNVGRGGTVETAALASALSSGTIAGAALDVTDPEPLPQDHPLWRAPNLIVTPHVSSFSDVGREVAWEIARENLRRYVAGERMLSVVDIERGY